MSSVIAEPKYPIVQDLELKNRRVFIRVDFNVPLAKHDDHWHVSDARRIESALSTIRYVIERGGRCILASHLGRPEGKPNPKFSLEPIGQKLSELLDREVLLSDDCIGDGPRTLSQRLREGQVLLLENLRFHPGEEKDTPEFAAKLAELCDVYVTDAFGTLHRAHASTYGLPRLVKDKGLGLLVQKEVQYLTPLRTDPVRPFALVLGGAKVSDKIALIENFLGRVDGILIGGAMAYAFLKAQGIGIGKSKCDDKQVEFASKVLKGAVARKIPVYLPLDHGVVPDLETPDRLTYTSGQEVPAGQLAVDIGPKTVVHFLDVLSKMKTLFWNGPLGVFEVPQYAKGTFDLASGMGGLNAVKMAGGGDVAAAISASQQDDKFDFISTGGGATLEYLEGKALPGLKVMEIGGRPQ